MPGTVLTRVQAAEPQALSRARILSPATGTVLAFDPDMPPDNQRLVLTATGGRDAAGLHWQIGSNDHAQGDQAYWMPRPGRHRIVLRNAQGTLLDEVEIQVRGLPGWSAVQ